MQPSLVLAIDLGGTKIATALVSEAGDILARHRVATPAREGYLAVVHAIVQASLRTLEKNDRSSADLASIGVGAPGIVNMSTGVVQTSPNLAGWRDVPLKEMLEQELHRDTYVINDARAATLGEHRYGAGQGARNFVYVTISTGVGGGIVIDGELYTGAIGAAGEIGHMKVVREGPQCGCGNIGCWETLASGTALAREARVRIHRGEGGSLLSRAGGMIGKVTPELISKAADDGDDFAKELVAWSSHYLGVGLANLIYLFNPELIVIGGGLTGMGSKLLEPAYRTARQRAQGRRRVVSFALAKLGPNSVVLGAAAFARSMAAKKSIAATGMSRRNRA